MSASRLISTALLASALLADTPTPSFGLSIVASSQRPDDRCIVASVHDGDTLRCTDGRRVRLLGIDAPELTQPSGAASRAALQRLAPRGQRLTLESDVQPRDKFGRLLAYVRRDGRLLNEAMVRSGMAVTLTFAPNVRYVEELRSAQADARRTRSGLWSSGGFACMPKAHRQRRC